MRHTTILAAAAIALSATAAYADDLKIDLQQVNEDLAAGGSVIREEMPRRLSASSRKPSTGRRRSRRGS